MRTRSQPSNQWGQWGRGFGGDGGAGEAVGLLEGPIGEVAGNTGANPRVEGGSMREADAIAQWHQDGRSTIDSYKKSRSVSIVFGEVCEKGKTNSSNVTCREMIMHREMGS
jgi:hypothetical protein